MPKTVKAFTPDPDQLERGIGHACYEYANLMSAAHWDMHGSAPWRTHADDAFLLGCRKLGDFLLDKDRSTFNGQELPDILALDYLPSGHKPNWSLPIWISEWRDPMNKQLAHLSYVRDKRWVHYEWVPKLKNEFRTAWQNFLDAIDPNYKGRFVSEIAKCQSKPGFADIKL
jgi:hypothetical protein